MSTAIVKSDDVAILATFNAAPSRFGGGIDEESVKERLRQLVDGEVVEIIHTSDKLTDLALAELRVRFDANKKISVIGLDKCKTWNQVVRKLGIPPRTARYRIAKSGVKNPAKRFARKTKPKVSAPKLIHWYNEFRIACDAARPCRETNNIVGVTCSECIAAYHEAEDSLKQLGQPPAKSKFVVATDGDSTLIRDKETGEQIGETYAGDRSIEAQIEADRLNAKPDAQAPEYSAQGGRDGMASNIMAAQGVSRDAANRIVDELAGDTETLKAAFYVIRIFLFSGAGMYDGGEAIQDAFTYETREDAAARIASKKIPGTRFEIMRVDAAYVLTPAEPEPPKKKRPNGFDKFNAKRKARREEMRQALDSGELVPYLNKKGEHCVGTPEQAANQEEGEG